MLRCKHLKDKFRFFYNVFFSIFVHKHLLQIWPRGAFERVRQTGLLQHSENQGMIFLYAKRYLIKFQRGRDQIIGSWNFESFLPPFS